MGLMKKLTSALVASSLVFAMVGSAFAAYTPAAGETAGNRMQSLGIINGKPGIGLDLNGEITRAELVTVIVRAFGQEANAQLLKGSTAFPDTANHWASGNIAMAKALVEKAGSDAIGMPDGTFAPDAKLTPAQAVAFLMKFVGVKADAAKAWPQNFLDVAVEKNIITAEDAALIAPQLNTNATRGLVFYMFDRAFFSYNLPTGKTFYTQYVDTMAPVVTLNAIDATTIDSKVTVTGNVKDATSVFVGTTAVTPDASGNFSATYALPELKEYNITVTARDLAGNTTEKSAKITRAAGTAAAIEASDITVAAGGTVEVKAVVKDAAGNVLTTPVTATATAGTYADGKYTAGAAAGTATLTLKAGEVSKDVKVTVTAGVLAKVVPSVVAAKVGEQVTLTAQDASGNTITGVSYSQTSDKALLDGVKGIFVASEAGNYTVTASKDGVSVPVTLGVYSSTVKKVVVSAPATVVGNTVDADANGAQSASGDTIGTVYEVTVKAVDANGNLVASYDRDITLSLPVSFIMADDDDATAVVVAGKTTGITKAATNGAATFKVLALFDSIGRQYDFSAQTTLADATVIGDSSTELTKATTEIVEQVATSVKISTTNTAKYIRANDAGDTTTASVYIADQNGKKYLETTGYTVNLSMTGAATFAVDALSGKTSATTAYSGASKAVTFESIRGRVGDATLTATVDGLGTATASVTAAIAGDAAAVTMTTDVDSAIANDKEAITYKLQVVDANGVPVAESVALKGTFAFEDTDSELTLTDNGDGAFANWTVDATNDVTTFEITTAANGKATFTLEATKFVGDLKLTVKDNDAGFTVSSVEKTVSFKADSAKEFALVRSDVINVGSAAPTTQVSAQLYDLAGNKAPVAGKKLTFTAYTADANTGAITATQTSDVKLNGTAKTIEVTTDAEGKATVDVSVLGYVGRSFYVAVTGETGLAATAAVEADVKISVQNAVTSTMAYTLEDNTGAAVTRVKAGEAVTVKVTAKDAAGKIVDNAAIYLVPTGTAYTTNAYATKLPKTLDTSAASVQDLAFDGVDTYSITIYPATSGNFSFKLVDTASSANLEQAGQVRVIAGAANKLVINDGNDVKVAEAKASEAVTVKLTDRFGNAVAYTKALDMMVLDNTSAAYAAAGVRTAVNAPNVTKVTLPTGQSSTQFYVWNSLAKGTYAVTFTATDTTPDPDAVFSGTFNVVVE